MMIMEGVEMTAITKKHMIKNLNRKKYSRSPTPPMVPVGKIVTFKGRLIIFLYIVLNNHHFL